VNRVYSNYLLGTSINHGDEIAPSGGDESIPADNTSGGDAADAGSADAGGGGGRRFL